MALCSDEADEGRAIEQSLVEEARESLRPADAPYASSRPANATPPIARPTTDQDMDKSTGVSAVKAGVEYRVHVERELTEGPFLVDLVAS